MFQYEGDERALTRFLTEANGIMDHAAARVFAAGYNAPDTAAFVTTGEIPTDGDGDEHDDDDVDGPAEWLMEDIRRGVDSATLARDSDALEALHAYLTDRVANGDTGPVDGWAALDIPRHVDYPHETGALDTCWCYDETDED